jgi:putative transposase
VINRGNSRALIFHDSGDYAAFLSLMDEARERCKLSVLAACLMPNHIHLVVMPDNDSDLKKWMHWLFTAHVRRHHAKHKSTGCLWQGRFKSFIVQKDQHLVTVLRYVERNPLRAGLVSRAEHWPWSSLRWRQVAGASERLAQSPVALPGNWIEYVNEPQTAAELHALRICVNRQKPFGNDDWVEHQAHALGVMQSLAPVGRPKSRR